MTLDEPSFLEARSILASAERVAVFSGAGLSAESGISTFRDQEPDALWSRFDPMLLASVEGFAENPGRVIDWYNWRRAKLAQATPNPAHLALAAQPGLVHITQNVDDLLERAGVSPERILRLHGAIDIDCCHAVCGFEERVDVANAPPLRPCPRCGAPVRPAVVWFGERLPEAAWQRSEAISAAVDCLLVVGTSATVYPAANLVHRAIAGGRAKIVVLNTRRSELTGAAHVELLGTAGSTLPKLLRGLSLHSD